MGWKIVVLKISKKYFGTEKINNDGHWHQNIIFTPNETNKGTKYNIQTHLRIGKSAIGLLSPNAFNSPPPAFDAAAFFFSPMKGNEFTAARSNSVLLFLSWASSSLDAWQTVNETVWCRNEEAISKDFDVWVADNVVIRAVDENFMVYMIMCGGDADSYLYDI